MRHGTTLNTVDLVAAKVRLRSIEERFNRCLGWLQKFAGELYAAQLLINAEGAVFGEQDHTSSRYVEVYRPHASSLVKEHQESVQVSVRELQAEIHEVEVDFQVD